MNSEGLHGNLQIEIPGLFNDIGFIKPKRARFVDEDEVTDSYDQYALFDCIEYIATNMKDYITGYRYSKFSHYHYNLIEGDKTSSEFMSEIRQTFEMVGLLYKMKDIGEIERIASNETLHKDAEKQTELIKE